MRCEAEDLLYAVKTKIQVLQRIEGIAWDYMNGRLAAQCVEERKRLTELEEKLEEHVGPHKPRADLLSAMVPGWSE